MADTNSKKNYTEFDAEFHDDWQDSKIIGTEGDDLIWANSGDDVVSAKSGDDLVYAGYGDDVVCGGEGDDKIWGMTSDDIIHAGDGDDFIGGGRGDDIMTGGSGADTFRFSHNSDDDIITDFTTGEDTLKLHEDYKDSITFTEDGGNLIVSYGDNTITLNGLSAEDTDSINIDWYC